MSVKLHARVIVWAAAWVAFALCFAFELGGDYPVSLATEIVILSLWAISYNLVYGYLGEISFGHRKTSRGRHAFQVLLAGGVVAAAFLSALTSVRC